MAVDFLKLGRWLRYWATRLIIWQCRHCPSRMVRRGRTADSVFAQTEKLFFRCRLEAIDGNRLKPADIRFPDQSVNREKYAKASDVLVPDASPGSREWLYWGVAFVRVSGIPHPLDSPGGVPHSFTVEHDPSDFNYSHSELRVYKNGIRTSKSKTVNTEVKKMYRQLLSEGTGVLISPLV